MEKPTGEVVLASAHDLRDDCVGLVPFANRDGPARLLIPGSPDTVENGTYSGIIGEGAAWPDAGDPFLDCGGNADQVVYEWTETPFTTLPFTIGIVYTPRASTPGYMFVLWDDANTGIKVSLQLSNLTGVGTRVRIDDGTTETIYTLTGTLQHTVGTTYSLIVELTNDGSGNVDIAVFRNGSDISGTQDANDVAMTGMDALTRLRIGTGVPPHANAYANADIHEFCMWDTAVLSAADKTKWHDEMSAGSSPTWALFESGVNDLAGAVVGGNAIAKMRGYKSPSFFRGPKLAYPSLPTVPGVVQGGGFGGGFR